MIKLGNAVLQHGILLAPLAGVTDHVFRTICRENGAEYAFSEMISAKALCYEQKCKKSNPENYVKTGRLATVYQDDIPIGIQLFGSSPSYMAEAALMIEDGSYLGCKSEFTPTSIDINMGCPVQKVTANGEGGALLKNPELCGEIISAIKAKVKLPVSAKIRIGWDENSINAVEVAKIIEQAGADWITVHGRTKKQLYAPGINYDIIKAVKETVSIPVIGNGDIMNEEDAVSMIQRTGVDGIMIARGALGNPWIFDSIAATLDHKAFNGPSIYERLSMALDHAVRLTEAYGEKSAIPQARKFMAWYTKGLHGSAEARLKIMNSTSLCELKTILDDLMDEAEGNRL